MTLTTFLQAAEAKLGRELTPDEAMELWQLYWREKQMEIEL